MTVDKVEKDCQYLTEKKEREAWKILGIETWCLSPSQISYCDSSLPPPTPIFFFWKTEIHAKLQKLIFNRLHR